jgi:hypothetical protein
MGVEVDRTGRANSNIYQWNALSRRARTWSVVAIALRVCDLTIMTRSMGDSNEPEVWPQELLAARVLLRARSIHACKE